MKDRETSLADKRKEAAAFLARPRPRLDIWRASGTAAAITSAKTGDLISGQGIFLGLYEPTDGDGNSLGKIFNVYAAPQDLPDTMKYTDAVKYIASLKEWYGFEGTNYATDKEIYAALKDGSYTGGWIIPPYELLMGAKPDGGQGIREDRVTQPDNLFDHRNKGAFKGAFKTAAVNGAGFPVWYWSSTEHRDNPSCGHAVRLADGGEDWLSKDGYRFSCRPVRLVEASAPASS